jgi:hypothetical protein
MSPNEGLTELASQPVPMAKDMIPTNMSLNNIILVLADKRKKRINSLLFFTATYSPIYSS